MSEQRVSDHYTRGDLLAAVESGLRALGKDPASLELEDLAPVDEFHIGGRPATARLIEQLDIQEGHAVVDIGSGLGGASRLVASRHGCRVVGIDLTREYCEVATALAARLGMGDRVEYHHGSALAMPFADRAYDVAYMLHVGMNIGDKLALYREIARVLVPGAAFGIYDVLRGGNSAPVTYPVPWASTADTSFLATVGEMTAALEQAGFAVERVEDRSAFAADFFARLQAAAGGEGPPPLGLHLVMGQDFKAKVANMVANVGDGRCAPWELICRRR